MSYPPSEIISATALRFMLRHPLEFRWRSHGIGMLRCYIGGGEDWRLNLWHPSLINEGISTMHTHPWAFESFIIAGQLQNTRFIRREGGGRPLYRLPPEQYWEGRIPCGAHAPNQHADGPLIEGEPTEVWLTRERPEMYRHAGQYQQAPEEIHDTRAEPGTITVMHRTAYDPEGRASVFWPVDQPWGDASRPTTEEDVLTTCAAALDRLNESPWRE